jgi:hypothetical protein
MNNTTTNLTAIVAIFMAATLVVGTFATVAAIQPAFAVPQKKPPGHGDKKTRDNDGSGNGNGNTVTIEECKNRGSASGFDTALDQECENLICTHPGNNATCTQEGAAATPTPVKLTCEQCFTTILNSKQKTDFETRFGTFAGTCAIFVDPAEGPPSENNFRSQLQSLAIPLPTINELIACLKQAGRVFTT